VSLFDASEKASKDLLLEIVGEEHTVKGVACVLVTKDSLSDFAEYVGALQREAIAEWLEEQPHSVTNAEAAQRIRTLRAEH
jgi:hypothetical protein